MRIKILTLFPDMFLPVLGASITGRAMERGILSIEAINIRDYTKNKHRRCDDYPYGGGAGMVMTPQPVYDCFRAATENFPARRILLSPRGKTLTQQRARELAQEENLIFLCGHYEGVDQRVIDEWIDEEISIGDYVLTGGELAAMVVIDCLSRHIPGVLGSDESAEEESFSEGLLEYPQYTRPAVYEGRAVPEVLLSGHDANIRAWRRERSLDITRERRPELLQTAPLTQKDRIYLGWEEAPPKRPRRKKKRPSQEENAQNLPENP
ncbi:MAG: tRNA (guanosine(37)-N1)-methyltransferase TrmD [Candidatus Spyradocola sp.]|jgi:tRNA (guanine37-N1)-methyltransferase